MKRKKKTKINLSNQSNKVLKRKSAILQSNLQLLQRQDNEWNKLEITSRLTILDKKKFILQEKQLRKDTSK